MQKAKEYAITIKGLFTDRLYVEYDYIQLYGELCRYGCNVEQTRYELDSKHRLHVHALVKTSGRLPYFRSPSFKGFHIYCVPNPNKYWLQYTGQTSSDVQRMEHTQLNTSWRRSGNQFSFLEE